MNLRIATLFLLSCSLAAAGLTGCASPAERSAMVPASVSVAQKHDASVSVRTSGGSDTGAMDSSNIADPDLKAAIEEGISKHGLFKQIIQGKGADYELSVSIIQLDKPIFGASFTVTLEAGWTVTRLSDRNIVLRKSIRSTHTAGMGDAFAGVTRLRLAVEGAVRSNIQQGLEEISRLKL